MAALATPSELTQLIAEAGGTARAVSLVATVLRVGDGHQLGRGTGVDALAPVARDAKLREALRAAAAADNGDARNMSCHSFGAALWPRVATGRRGDKEALQLPSAATCAS